MELRGLLINMIEPIGLFKLKQMIKKEKKTEFKLGHFDGFTTSCY